MNINLQDVLHTEIPLTKEIGIRVLYQDENSLTLTAPLENNINHKCTAFGGSLYSVSVLTGWGLIYQLLKLEGLHGHIVIQESSTKFLKPVDEDIVATCQFLSTEEKDRFIKMYQRKGLARIKLETHVVCQDDTAVVFTGTYVVHE